MQLNIGTEEVLIQPQSKRAIDTEIFLLHIPLFATVFAYASGFLAWPIFFALFYALEMRIFIGNHDRFHAHGRRFPRWLESFTEWVGVAVTPWDEPYDSIQRKHIRHHASHGPRNMPEHDVTRDPHSVFENGFVRALASSLFYEEVQLFLDLRNRTVAATRWVRVLVFLPLQVLFFVQFGWQAYLGLFVAMRLVGATAWFVFSWGIHHPWVYRFGFSRQVPRVLKAAFWIMNGERVTEGVIHHATHHAWPTIPPIELHRVDAAIVRNPHDSPIMRATT